MPKGIVKWFNNAKGFGFILADNTSEDIFAHYSAIEMDGFRTLKAGQPVEFDIIQADKGLHAANIRVAASNTPTNAPPKTGPAAKEKTTEQRKKETLEAEHA